MNARAISAATPIRTSPRAAPLPPAIDAAEGDVDIMGEGRVLYDADHIDLRGP